MSRLGQADCSLLVRTLQRLVKVLSLFEAREGFDFVREVALIIKKYCQRSITQDADIVRFNFTHVLVVGRVFLWVIQAGFPSKSGNSGSRI